MWTLYIVTGHYLHTYKQKITTVNCLYYLTDDIMHLQISHNANNQQ